MFVGAAQFPQSVTQAASAQSMALENMLRADTITTRRLAPTQRRGQTEGTPSRV
jgi:hypothetical protein